MSPAETVGRIYQLFGQGDVAGILALISEDVDWEYGGGSTDVPWLQPRRGRESVAGFFTALHALEFHRFVPTHILSEGDLVVSLVDLEITVKETGKRFVEIDEAHIWYFDGEGRVRRFRHRADTHMQQLAIRA